MPNDISGSFFKMTDAFAVRIPEILETVCKETRFCQTVELFRGRVYADEKVGSVIFQGTWKNKPAVLKLQGLKPDMEEVAMMDAYERQTRSKRIRVPKRFVHRPHTTERGYGYTIMEQVTGTPLYTPPFATREQMRDFAAFYQEYHEQALVRPWMDAETTSSLLFVMKRVDRWRALCEDRGRLDLKDYAPYVMDFCCKFAPLCLRSHPMVFMHGHLTADDIRRQGKRYVIFSNLFWSYRPQWYDLAFNIWSCLTRIRDTSFTTDQAIGLIEEWTDVYRAIPAVKATPTKLFEIRFTSMLLERFIGAILADLGANDTFAKPENKAYRDHLLCLFQNLFRYYGAKLSRLTA